MRIAAYNVENLFERALALNLPTYEAGRQALQNHAEINTLLNKPSYTDADKQRIIELLVLLGLDRDDDSGPFVRLRQNHGRLLQRPSSGIEIIADGRAEWVGWVELKTGPVSERATEYTARVVKDVDPDILGVVEVENRIALKNFSDELLPSIGGTPYDQVMVIEGNDTRGIDVGIMVRRGCTLSQIRPHVYDRDAKGIIFSRDCPEYVVATPTGQRLIILVNHLKSKGYGGTAANNAKRKRQSERIAQIYQQLLAEGETNVVVLGDLNDTPAAAPLAPLLGGTDLRDVSTHPNFVSDGRPGTFGNGTKSDKIDYILLSPALYNRVTKGGVWRKGVWGGKRGTLWPHYEPMDNSSQAASDHAAIFVDINL